MPPGPRNGEGRPKDGPRDYPANNVPRSADERRRRASRALQAFGRFELALVDLIDCPPRGDELAAVLSISSERLKRHYTEPYGEITQEWDWAA